MPEDFDFEVMFQKDEEASTKFLGFKNVAIIYFLRGARFCMLDISQKN